MFSNCTVIYLDVIFLDQFYIKFAELLKFLGCYLSSVLENPLMLSLNIASAPVSIYCPSGISNYIYIRSLDCISYVSYAYFDVFNSFFLSLSSLDTFF